MQARIPVEWIPTCPNLKSVDVLQDYVFISGESGVILKKDENVSVDDHVHSSPLKLNNFPNPFNPNTTISFSISSEPGSVELRHGRQYEQNELIELNIYNVKGQKVKSFDYAFILRSSTTENAQDDRNGNYSVIWDGKDDNGNSVESGVYLYKLEVDGRTQAVKKMALLR